MWGGRAGGGGWGGIPWGPLWAQQTSLEQLGPITRMWTLRSRWNAVR